MSSAGKTLELLAYFTPDRPEIGLSQMCRLANRDKATTYRHLQALEDAGFVEKNSLNKHYRIGPAVLQLAQTREITVPRKSGADDAIKQLAHTTGETSHVSVLSGTTLYALTSCESQKHSARIVIDLHSFPLHATASGICALAFGPKELLDVAQNNLERFTPKTITNLDDLKAALESTLYSGFAQSDGNFETDARSLASPVFDQSGHYAGSVSVASVATRFTNDLERLIKTQLMAASRQITRNWGGTVPTHLEKAWERTSQSSYSLETIK